MDNGYDRSKNEIPRIPFTARERFTVKQCPTRTKQNKTERKGKKATNLTMEETNHFDKSIKMTLQKILSFVFYHCPKKKKKMKKPICDLGNFCCGILVYFLSATLCIFVAFWLMIIRGCIGCGEHFTSGLMATHT